MENYQFGVPTGAEEEMIDDELVAYNLQKVPCRQREPFVKFCRCARNEGGELIGGVLACSILWNILSVEALWVAPEYRGQGIAAPFQGGSGSEGGRLLSGAAGYI